MIYRNSWDISEQEIKETCSRVFQIFRTDPLFYDEIPHWDWRVSALIQKEDFKGSDSDKDEVREAVAHALTIAASTAPSEAIARIKTEIKTLSEKIERLPGDGENARQFYIERKHHFMFCLAYCKYMEGQPAADHSAGVDQSENNRKTYITRLLEAGLITISPYSNGEGKKLFFTNEKFTPKNIKECLNVKHISWKSIAEFKQIIPKPYQKEGKSYDPIPMDSTSLMMDAHNKARKEPQ